MRLLQLKHMAPCALRSKVTAGPVSNLPVPYCRKYCMVPNVSLVLLHLTSCYISVGLFVRMGPTANS